MTKPRILYIEDHEDTRELISIVLRQLDFEVVTESSIENGIRLAVRDKYDLYLLDSWLADGSGLELCRKIREFDSATPILFYSAAAYEVDKAAAIASGAQGYLIKPTLTSELCDTIFALISQSAANRSVVTKAKISSSSKARR